MYRKLLIPTDGTELATKAVTQGVGLAKETGASVILVAVTDMWSPWEISRESRMGGVNPIAVYEEHAKKAADKVLAGARKVAEAAGVAVETLHVADKATADGIVDAAKEKGADLIVMATHARRGIGQLLLGSETTEVLHLSKIPVLVVR
jgi:nucleotide-binding universal stress UspA family protein